MRLKTKAKRSPHARLRGRVEPKRTAHLSREVCEHNTTKANATAALKYCRREPKRVERDRAIKARAAAKLKAPPKPVFESAPPAPNEPRRSAYVGPGSKWHRRMVESGRKG